MPINDVSIFSFMAEQCGVVVFILFPILIFQAFRPIIRVSGVVVTGLSLFEWISATKWCIQVLFGKLETFTAFKLPNEYISICRLVKTITDMSKAAAGTAFRRMDATLEKERMERSVCHATSIEEGNPRQDCITEEG